MQLSYGPPRADPSRRQKGAARPVAQFSSRTGFLLQGDGPAEASLVNTGVGWKVLRDSAYVPIVITTAFMGNYFAAAPGVK